MRFREAGPFLDAPIGAGGDRQLRVFVGETISAEVSPLSQTGSLCRGRAGLAFQGSHAPVQGAGERGVEREIPGGFRL